MLTDKQQALLSEQITTWRVMAAAMTCGGVFFSAAVLSTCYWEDLHGPVKLLSTLAAASTIILFGIAFVAPSLFARLPVQTKSSQDPQARENGLREICGFQTTRLVTRLALLEAGVFVNVLTLMLEPRLINAIAAASGLLLMLISFPWWSGSNVKKSYQEWIDG